MARVFTTQFQYKGATYTALIKQVDGSISISVPDTELHSLLPDGKAVYSMDKGLELSSPRLTEAQSLIVAILSAAEAKSAVYNHPAAPNAGRGVE